MVYSLAYRRPAYVVPEIYASRQSESEKGEKEESLRSGKSGKNSGIPAALAFEKIVHGGTCAVSTRFSAGSMWEQTSSDASVSDLFLAIFHFLHLSWTAPMYDHTNTTPSHARSAISWITCSTSSTRPRI